MYVFLDFKELYMGNMMYYLVNNECFNNYLICFIVIFWILFFYKMYIYRYLIMCLYVFFDSCSMNKK